MFSLDLSASRCGLLPQSLVEVDSRYDVRACINLGSGYIDLVKKVSFTVHPAFSVVPSLKGLRSSQSSGSYGVSIPAGVANGAPISFLVVGQAVAGQCRHGISNALDGSAAPRIYVTNGVMEARAVVAGNTSVTITGPTIAYDSDYVGIVRWRPGVGIAASFNGGAVQTSSNSQTSLYVAPDLLWYGVSTATRAYLIASFGDVSDADMQALSANPSLLFRPVSSPIWLSTSVANTVITCTVGNASATGPTARLNRAVKATVGDAGAAGVTAALNRKIVTQVGDAIAAGVGASLSRRILTSPGDAQAAGVASQLARTIVTTPGDAACSGVQATISVAGATTITCTVGDATAAGVDAVLRRDVTITCTPGDAEAAGVPASVLAPTIISCTVGNAVAAGVTALLETSMTLTSADIAAIADAVWAHPKALTVQKFLGLK